MAKKYEIEDIGEELPVDGPSSGDLYTPSHTIDFKKVGQIKMKGDKKNPIITGKKGGNNFPPSTLKPNIVPPSQKLKPIVQHKPFLPQPDHLIEEPKTRYDLINWEDDDIFNM
jgi:hypothetical protein